MTLVFASNKKDAFTKFVKAIEECQEDAHIAEQIKDNLTIQRRKSR